MAQNHVSFLKNEITQVLLTMRTPHQRLLQVARRRITKTSTEWAGKNMRSICLEDSLLFFSLPV